jgi:hypothetical protein
LSRRADRQPIKRHRDAAQAEAVAALVALVATYLTHLPFEAEQLRMLPKEFVTEAAPFVRQERHVQKFLEFRIHGYRQSSLRHPVAPEPIDTLKEPTIMIGIIATISSSKSSSTLLDRSSGRR